MREVREVRGLFPHSLIPLTMQNMRVCSVQTYCKSFYMSYLYRFRNPSFHCVQCHSKDFRLHHCLLLCKVRGKHFLLYPCSQKGSQAATLIKGFIYLLTLAVIISFVLLSKCGIAAFHQSKNKPHIELTIIDIKIDLNYRLK